MSNIKTYNKSRSIKYLGIDYGEKRIGLALADSETKIATPFKVVSSPEEIAKIVVDEVIDMLIVGKPYQISNSQFPIAKQFTNFINDLKTKIKIPIEFIDERLSSKAADARSGNRKTKAPRDAVAAMIILQSYLDRA